MRTAAERLSSLSSLSSLSFPPHSTTNTAMHGKDNTIDDHASISLTGMQHAPVQHHRVGGVLTVLLSMLTKSPRCAILGPPLPLQPTTTTTAHHDSKLTIGYTL